MTNKCGRRTSLGEAVVSDDTSEQKACRENFLRVPWCSPAWDYQTGSKPSDRFSKMKVMSSFRDVAETDWRRSRLRLFWSQAISGTELYNGENVETFATGWHFHEGWQFVAVTKGERRYEFRSGAIVAKPGCLVLVPPRLVHRAHCLDRNTSFKIATLPAGGLNVETSAAPICRPISKLFDAFISAFEGLQGDSKCEPKAEVLSRLQTILIESASSSPAAFFNSPSFVVQLESYLLNTLDKIPSLDFLSSLAGVSRYHFAHIFTRHVGLSPLAFHTRARLIRSRKLISEGRTLADTSLSLRFSDQSHFGRQFKKVYGMTPREYQQSLAC
jgi:AraC-like DNA-binding protein